MSIFKTVKSIVLAFVLLVMSNVSVAGVWSPYKTLGAIKDPLNGDYFYVAVPGGLGALGCSGASWLIVSQVKDEVDNIKDPRILIMAAKLAGKRVSVFGVCNTANPAYFEVEWIMVE